MRLDAPCRPSRPLHPKERWAVAVVTAVATEGNSPMHARLLPHYLTFVAAHIALIAVVIALG
jgi:hypothetical protein